MSRDLQRAARATALAMSLSCAATPASAEGEDERAAARLFRAGTAAFEAGDYTAAAHAFEEAHRRVPRGAAVYNAALAWEAAKQPARAADGYEGALADGTLASAAADDARKRLAALERALGVIEVTGPFGSTVSASHVSEAKTTRRIHLEPREHVVTLRYPSGRVERRLVAVRAQSAIAITFAPEPAPQAPAPTADRTSDAPKTQRVVGWLGVGSAVAFTGVAAVLGVKALSARDEYDASGRTDLDARSDAVAYRTWANVSWAAAGVLGATGVVLVLTAPSTTVKLGRIAGSIQVTPASIAWSKPF